MDVWFIILISLSLCFCIKFLLHLPSNSTKTNQSKTGKLPPGPSPLPFIGNLHLLPKTTVDLRSFLRSLSLKYGPVTTLHIGSEPVVFITSYSAAHEALVRNSAAFASRPSIVPLSSVLSNKRKDIGGSPYGQTWRVLRRNLNSEVLHPARVKSYSLERKRILGTLVNSFNQCFLHGDQPVRVLTHIHHAVFSLFILMAFGHVNDSTIREVERIQAELIFNYEQFTVFCSWPRLGKLLFRDRWKRYLNILKSQAEIILPLIRARKKLKQEESKQSELVSYTDTLLDMQMNNNHHQEFGKLEEADILSLCSEFMNAGADTSLTTLQWIMANIVKHPHIQAKLFAEIKAVVGEGAEEIKEEDVQKMTYLKAVVLETLRIHPPSTFLVPHAVLEDAEVLGYRIPKDTTVNFAISLMGRDPKEWKGCQEVANTKPLLTAIYATVIVGVIFSSFYVFSAIYSANSAANSKISWLSAPSVSFSTPTRQELNFSRSATVDTVLGSTPGPQTLWVPPIWAIPPRTEKMPPLKTFRLSKELVQKRVKDNIIVVTFGNYAFMDFILTWVKHLTDLGLSNLLVGAMDTKLLEALYWKGVPVFDMGSHMSTIDVGWGSPTFHKMGREKVILIDSILPFGYELLMCDTDMVWLKNPLPYLARYPGADVLTSSDQVIPTVVDDSLDIWQQVSGAYNIGVFHWRPTHSAKKLAREWKDMLLANEKIWDQNGFNDIVRRQLGPSVDEDSGLVYAFDGQLKLGILPASIFCSGHTYFVQTMYQQLRLEPYAVHTTFQYAGTEGKRHRLREAMFFYDPPDYYDSPGGFLSFRPSIPKSLLLDGEHNIESHFSLVNYQIKQIRTALAIALLLNRTLVRTRTALRHMFLCFVAVFTTLID